MRILIWGRLSVCLSLLLLREFATAAIWQRRWAATKATTSGSANEPEFWAYKGSLIDPLTGKTISGVEGIELRQDLAETNDDEENMARFQRRCRGLQVADIHDGTLVSKTWLSCKLFCYTQNGQLLKSHRKRPTGPQTKIPRRQAASLYETCTSQICLKSDGGSASGRCLFHSELPNGKAIWSDAPQADICEDGDSPRRTLFSRLQTKALTRQDLERAVDRHNQSSSAPARSALVQFGASKQESSKFGARETYSANTRDTFLYTRYGEAPVWYGPGRMCQMELQAQRLSKEEVALVVPVVYELADQHSFWSRGLTSSQQQINENDATFRYYADSLQSALDPKMVRKLKSASAYQRFYSDLRVGRRVDRFREHPPSLHAPDDEDSWWYHPLHQATSWWDRLCAATSVSSDFETD